MFLELAEALDCPQCLEGAGLVAFVGRGEGGRVREGWLGCPLCELAAPIRDGAMRFEAVSAEDPSSAEGSADPGRPPPPPPDAAVVVGALLDVRDEAGMIVLLGPGLAAAAAEVAAMGDRIEVIAWDGADGEGVNALLGAGPDRWPVRAGALRGVAVLGPLALAAGEAARCLRPGARLLVLEPQAGDAEACLDAGFRELVADARAWLGERR